MTHYASCIVFLTVSLYVLRTESLSTQRRNNNIEEFIDEINSIQSDWVAEENAFTRLAPSEKKKLFGVKTKPNQDNSYEYINYDIEVPNDIPETFDAREQWPHCDSIGSIKDQSNCASCWAISAASVMSDRLCIATDAQIHVNLSSEVFISCCAPCIGGDPEGGCDGGFLDETWKYWINHGTVTGGDYASDEGCQPYGIKPCRSCTYQADTPACLTDSCTNKRYQKAYTNDIHKGKSYYKLPKDVASIQADILKYGPLQAGFIAYDDFVSYKTGVYRHVKGDSGANHAVRIIGWGVENDTPYWLVANSWARWWGEDGLFKIIRGKNECGFEENVYAGIPEANIYNI